MSTPPEDLAGLLAALQAEAVPNRTPPVHLWNPARCTREGDFQILADGAWHHEGSPIGRATMVRLFSSILRKDEDGETYLVTPGEKVRVWVQDAPFVAVRADRAGKGQDQAIAFTTNVGDVAVAGPDHPIRVAFGADGQTPRPYVLVRGRLEARILRAPFYHMAEWASVEAGVSGVWSGGAFFPLEPKP